jgi:hypothetical protein
MQNISFDEFWENFEEEIHLLKDVMACSDQLFHHLIKLSHVELSEFIPHFLSKIIQRKPGYKILLQTLPQLPFIGNHNLISTIIIEKLKNPVLSGYEEPAELSFWIGILAREASVEYEEIIKNYLLEIPISPYWTRIPVILKTVNPSLTLLAWRRYFLSEPVENWDNTYLLSILKKDPEFVQQIIEEVQNFIPQKGELLHQAIENAPTLPESFLKS